MFLKPNSTALHVTSCHSLLIIIPTYCYCITAIVNYSITRVNRLNKYYLIYVRAICLLRSKQSVKQHNGELTGIVTRLKQH